MACSTCGSHVPCGCRPLQNDSCCQNLIPATPQPYYQCASACPEGHTQQVFIQQFVADLKIQDTWNVPACNGTATVTSVQLIDIVVGSYLWNPEYGYFEITAFNSATNQITLYNHCNEGNAAEGTNVPSCTPFTVTTPPADSSTPTDGPCVAIDFTAPDVGDCIDITLTSTTGIAVGYLVDIGTGQYRVSALKPNDIITICNDGSGITPGTPVIARDPQGHYQYCLQIIAVNPCTNTSELQGKLVVCTGGDALTTLKSGGGGWVPVTLDPSGEVEFRPLETGGACTQLAATWHILNATQHYTIQVDDTSGFTTGNKLVIDNRTDRFVVSNVVSPTQLEGDLFPPPGSNATVDIGTPICTIGCCEVLSDIIDDMTVGLAAFSNFPAAITTGTINTEGQYIYGNDCALTITNPTNRNMIVQFTWNLLGDGELDTPESTYAAMTFGYEIGEAVGPIGTTAPVYTDSGWTQRASTSGAMGIELLSRSVGGTTTAVLVPGDEYSVKVRPYWQGLTLGALASFNVHDLRSSMSAFSVAA